MIRTVFFSVLAVLAGLLIGGMVNMAIVMWGPLLIPPPKGADVSGVEGLKASLHLFHPRHFIMPFLAHAAGTFTGALIAARFPDKPSRIRALLVSASFFLGGVMNVQMLPAPLWFNIADLLLAYFPAGYAAFFLLNKYSKPGMLR